MLCNNYSITQNFKSLPLSSLLTCIFAAVFAFHFCFQIYWYDFVYSFLINFFSDFEVFTGAIVLISCGCGNKLPQTYWLNRHLSWGHESEISYTGPKSRCQQAWVPSGGSRGSSIPCLFQLLGAAIIPCLVAVISSSSDLSCFITTWPSALFVCYLSLTYKDICDGI